jgi:hypothetical protein
MKNLILKTNPMILFGAILLILLFVIFPLTNCLNSITYRIPEDSLRGISEILDEDDIVEIEIALQKAIRKNIVTEHELNTFFNENSISIIEDNNLSSSAGLTERISGIGNEYVIRVGNIDNMNILRHEFIHIAILASGNALTNELHHQIMREHNLCYSACP